jgi:hypothetical protein
MASEVKQRCFVIMPFSETSEKHTEEYWTNNYKTFIKPLIESRHPLIAGRSAPLRGDILRQIITELVTATIIVADLTDANPNVYWELGVRQSFKHCTITIAEEGTILPFDLGGKGTLFYFPSNHIKMQEFINAFHQAIDDCLKNPGLPDSHVLETISGRGTLHQIIIRDESLRRLDSLISEIEHNAFILLSILNCCNENIQKEKEAASKKGAKVSRQITTGRFRTVAVEMLVVSRYIDADKTFYDVAEDYMDTMMRLNDQLATWEINPKSFESWLLKIHGGSKLGIDEFKKLVIEQKEAIKAIL